MTVDILDPKYLTLHAPCKECPFKCGAMRGWFGPYNAQYYFDAAISEVRLQCHMTTDTGKERHCTGVALSRAISFKVPRMQEQYVHQEKCEAKYSVTGIMNFMQFKEYHGESYAKTRATSETSDKNDVEKPKRHRTRKVKAANRHLP